MDNSVVCCNGKERNQVLVEGKQSPKSISNLFSPLIEKRKQYSYSCF